MHPCGSNSKPRESNLIQGSAYSNSQTTMISGCQNVMYSHCIGWVVAHQKSMKFEDFETIWLLLLFLVSNRVGRLQQAHVAMIL